MTGVRDYVRKNGFRSVILALSGGIDSALAATIAVDAIGPSNVHGCRCPAGIRRSTSVTDAAELAKRHGLTGMSIPIAPMVDAFGDALPRTASEGCRGEPAGPGARRDADGDCPTRSGHLVLTTGNKSELAIGYSTLYGDSAGGFAPIKDVPKTLVWELSRWRNAQAERGEPPPDPAELHHQAAERRAAPPDSSTATRCPTTRCWTRCSTTTSRRTWARLR